MDISTHVADSQAALDEFLATADAASGHWTTPRAPGKWSPAQVAEHVARSFDQITAMIEGRPHGFPKLPFFLRPIARKLVLTRTLQSGTFPTARTFKDFNPQEGPTTPAAARERLRKAHQVYLDACHARARLDGKLTSSVFGTVPVGDYMRFSTMHIRHHQKQIPVA